MEEKDLGVFGLGILGAFFGMYANEEKMHEMKAWFGKLVKEQGGSESVWEKYRDSLPKDTQKEYYLVSEMVNEVCDDLKRYNHDGNKI